MWDQDSSLAPSLLVAMPQLQDPNFSKSVVLLCEHREEGAMGLVINRCTDTLASAIVQLEPMPERATAACRCGSAARWTRRAAGCCWPTISATASR